MKKLTVPCGTAIILWNGNAILLGKRKGAHGAGEWSFPGGRLEPGEDPRAAVIRELKEETGIIMEPYQIDRCSIPYNNTITGGQPWVTLLFWGGTDQEPKVMEPDKCERWDWFEPERIPTPLFAAAEDVLRKLRLLEE